MRTVDIMLVCVLGRSLSMWVGAYPLPQMLERDAPTSTYVSAHYAWGAEGWMRGWIEGGAPGFSSGFPSVHLLGVTPEVFTFFSNPPLKPFATTQNQIAHESGTDLEHGHLEIDASHDGTHAETPVNPCDTYCQDERYAKVQQLSRALEDQRQIEEQRRQKDEEFYRVLEDLHADNEE